MKLKQIDFNADLIGQDGIVVKTSDGIDVKQLTFFKCDDKYPANKYPLIGTVNGGLCQWGHDGKFDSVATFTLPNDLIMYKEVKAMTVDEFYYKMYYRASLDTSVRQFAHKLAAAVKAGEVEA
jgi:hypothetical protein